MVTKAAVAQEQLEELEQRCQTEAGLTSTDDLKQLLASVRPIIGAAIDTLTDGDIAALEPLSRTAQRLWNLAGKVKQLQDDETTTFECDLRQVSVELQADICNRSLRGIDRLLEFSAAGCCAWLEIEQTERAHGCLQLHERALSLRGSSNVSDLPSYLDVLLARARLMRASNQLADAILDEALQRVSTEQSFKASSKAAAALFAFGVADINAEKYEVALHLFKQCQQIWQEIAARGDHSNIEEKLHSQSQVWNCIAQCYLQLGSYAECTGAAKKAQECKSSPAAVYILLDCALRQNDAESANACLTEIISSTEDEVHFDLTLAAIEICLEHTSTCQTDTAAAYVSLLAHPLLSPKDKLRARVHQLCKVEHPIALIVSLCNAIKDHHSKDPAFKEHLPQIAMFLGERSQTMWNRTIQEPSYTLTDEELKDSEHCTQLQMDFNTEEHNDPELEGPLHRMMAYIKMEQDDMSAAEVHIRHAETKQPEHQSTHILRCTHSIRTKNDCAAKDALAKLLLITDHHHVNHSTFRVHIL